MTDVHPEAEILEHNTSDRLATALDAFLNHPKYCPHGGVIPAANGKFDSVSHRLLADAEDGETVVIERFLDNHELHAKVKVIKHEPFEGPILVECLDNDQQLSISYKASHNIFVNQEPLQD